MFSNWINYLNDSKTLHAFIVGLLGTVCYINALGCDFVFDDASAVKGNKDIRTTTPLSEIFYNDFWGTPMTDERSHGSYRPLCVISFRLNYLLSELEPMSYHLVNVIIHAVVSLLVYWMFLVLAFPPFSAFMASMLFALHPIHTEAVTGVVGRAELLSAAFFVASIICYALSSNNSTMKRFMYLTISLTAIPLAALSKETGITVAGLLLIYEIIFNVKWQPRLPFSSLRGLINFISLLRIFIVVGTTLAFLYARLKLMPQMPHFSVLDNPAAHSSFPIKQLTFAYLIPINVMLLLYPWPLVADWALGTVPLVESVADPRNITTAVFFICLFAAGFITAFGKPFDRRVAFCVALTIIPFIPASNLFFPVGFVVAERVLYLPSIGWCALVAIGFERVINRISLKGKFKLKEKSNFNFDLQNPLHYLMSMVLIILISFLVRSFCRNYDWADQVSLFRSGLRFNQKNAKLFNNVGHTYESDNKWPEAFAYFYKAVRTHPTDVGAHRNCARALRNLNQPLFAQRSLRRAIRLIPTSATVGKGITKTRVTPAHLDAFLDLAALVASSGTREFLEEAEDLYSKVLQMRPDYMPAFERRGEIMFKLGRLDESRRMFKEGIKYNPSCANCYYNLAVVDITQTPNDAEKISAALGLLEMALQLDPYHHHAMHAFASIVQERRVFSLYDRARQYIQKFLDSERANIDEKGNIGEEKSSSLMAGGDMNAKVGDALFRAAMLETDLRNFEKARLYYLAALKRDPTGKSILFNMAWLHYKDLNKPKESLPYLKTLLKSYPDHVTGWLLMGYVHLNHTYNYKKARKAFEKCIVAGKNRPEEASSITTAHFELCRLFDLEGDPKTAIICLEQLAKHHPQDEALKNEIKTLRKRHADLFVK